MSIEQITVEIFNRQFTIGAPDNERATLLKAVDLLNQKIQTMETEKNVIMASLNLTYDLLKMNDSQQKKDLPNDEYQHKIDSLIELCDSALK